MDDSGSKIEGSYESSILGVAGQPDIDVSYVDGYSVPITCYSNGMFVSGCNIDLFAQQNVSCGDADLVEGPICLNRAKSLGANATAPPFFAACAGAAYTFPTDDKANRWGVGALTTCCIGTDCTGLEESYETHMVCTRRRNKRRHGHSH